MRAGLRTVAAGAFLATRLGAAPGAAAQDVEALAELRGLTLPAAYYERIARDPLAFELPNGLFARSSLARAQGEPLSGTARIPVVLALFSDSPQPHITPEQVSASLFAGPAPSGTLTDFYLELSRGAFRVEGEVLPWVRTPVSLGEAVGNSSGLGGTAELGRYLVQALAAHDREVDFSAFDSDGPDGVPNSGDDDGVVDVVAFEFLEVAASCEGPGVWPHRSSIAAWSGGSPYVTDDRRAQGGRVLVNGYIIQSVADCSGREVQTSGTIAHEFGHVLGLPDYYHPVGGITPENRRWVLGCWELMAAGAWGCGPVAPRTSFGPVHMTAHPKDFLGWTEFSEVGDVRDEEVVLPPVQTSGRALRIPLDDAGGESLLLEYRPRAGFDRSLPAEGVLVTRLDHGGRLRPETGLRYLLRVVEADGNDGLVRTALEGGNRGEAGDVFGAPGSATKLNAVSHPELLLAATGEASSVAIHSVTVTEGLARVRLSTARTPELVAPGPVSTSVARAFEARILVTGGFMPYRLRLSASPPTGITVEAVEDEVVVSGVAQEKGGFLLPLRVVDARGSEASLLVPVTVGEFLVSDGRLLQPFLGSSEEPLGEAERAHLDGLGNGNGRYDVGDVRAWLTR